MYLIEYRLSAGEIGHYSTSALAAVRFVGDIQAGGGTLSRIVRTGDRRLLSSGELEVLAQQEIGPLDQRRPTLIEAMTRLITDSIERLR